MPPVKMVSYLFLLDDMMVKVLQTRGEIRRLPIKNRDRRGAITLDCQILEATDE